jgi:hypothetical protein
VALWAAYRERKRLREAATRDAFVQLGGRETLEWILVPRLREHWEEILGRRLSDNKARELSRELAESMAVEWPSVQMTPQGFIDRSVERWVQALRDETALNYVDFVFFPVFVWGFIQITLTNETGWLHWWQALPISISGAVLITVGWLWLRRKLYVVWE